LTISSLDLSLEPIENLTLSTVCGALDANVRRLEQAFTVTIKRRMAKFSIAGDAANAQAVKRALERFRYVASNGKRELTDEDVELTINELLLPVNVTNRFAQAKADAVSDVSEKNSSSSTSSTRRRSAKHEARAAALTQPETITANVQSLEESETALSGFDALVAQSGSTPLKTKRADLAARTPTQLAYLQNIQQYDITFGIGPAGTGKTYLAVACAVDAFERDLIKRIVLVRPAVEAGERLGFLPGDLIQKVDPYLRPLYDALFDLMGLEKTTKLMERGTIEVAPLAFMRGRTLNGSFIILDEAQNTTPEQMKMFLTRIGFGTKAVITGDPTQIDLQKNQKSGLFDAQVVLDGVPGIAFTRFTSVDVVRHPLVKRIVNAYERNAPRDK
jgi:phosphate starvation-inducible protein PhoH and related proteins